MRRLPLFAFILLTTPCALKAQSCSPGAGVTCTPNLNLWVLPKSYPNWDTNTNANWASIDATSVNWAKLNAVSQTFTGTITAAGFVGPLTGNVTGHASLDLPLAGGTLTGLLNGTSAAFSGNLSALTIDSTSVNQWQNPFAYGVMSNNSATTVTATGSNGSGSITLSGAGDFARRNGVMILHAGPACGSVKGTTCPTGPTPTVAPQGSTGSTSYSYQLRCLDGLGGSGTTGTAGSTSTGNATLAGVISGNSALTGNYNRVTWTGVSNCYEVGIYRNGAPIARQWSGASGTQTFNDVGLTTYTDRDFPSTPAAAGLNDNYDGIIQSISGTAATVSPNLGISVTTATMYHDDAPLIQAAWNASPFVQVPFGTYVLRYPLNLTKVSSSSKNAGALIGEANIYCDTGDICLDMTGSQNVNIEHLNFQPGVTAQSPIQLYLSRDTSNGDLAQAITTFSVGFNGGTTQTSGNLTHYFGGLGIVGIYNHAAEIQANIRNQYQVDRWMVLTSDNVDSVASVFSATDDRGTNSMSQVECFACFGSGQLALELENAFTVTYSGGYFLGGFNGVLGTIHPWAVEVNGTDSARLTMQAFRIEGKAGLLSVVANGQLHESKFFVDLYRNAPFATIAQIWLNDGALYDEAQETTIDDYGGSGAFTAPVVDGVNCIIAHSTIWVGIWQALGTGCNGGAITGAGNTTFGYGQNDFALLDTYQFTADQVNPSWVKLGTWKNQNQSRGNTLRIALLGGNGFTSGDTTQGEADILVRMGNQTGAPNLSGAQMVQYGSTSGSPGVAVYDQLKVKATGSSTSSTNNSWDIYIHESGPFSGGSYKVTKALDDVWIPDGSLASDPGSPSSSLIAGDVNAVAIQGVPASFSTVTATTVTATTLVESGQADGCAQFASGALSSTGVACGGGGGGGSVTSVGLAVPSWLSVAGSPVTTASVLTVTAATGQTAHRVIGTCGSATSFAPCALVAGDIPNIAESQVTNLTTDLAAKVGTGTTVNGHALSTNVVVSASDITTGSLPHAQLPALVSGDIPNNAANTSGTSGGLTGTPSVVLGSAKATTFYTNLDFCPNGGTWPSCTACTTAATIDPANGNNQTIILTAGSTCALTLTQPVGKEVVIQLTVIQSSSGGFNGLISGCTWPGGAGGGVAPVITPLSGAVDTVSVKLDSVHARCQIAQAFN